MQGINVILCDDFITVEILVKPRVSPACATILQSAGFAEP